MYTVVLLQINFYSLNEQLNCSEHNLDYLVMWFCTYFTHYDMCSMLEFGKNMLLDIKNRVVEIKKDF